MSRIILEGYILVKDSDLELVKNELPKHTELTRNEKGCVLFEVFQDCENKNRFNVCEEFENQESFNLHQQRVKKTKWGKVTADVSRHYAIYGGK